MMTNALPPATRIGNYRILKELGQGGFGVTYIAWDCQLERNVVLKECFPASICRRGEDGALYPLNEGMEAMYLQAMEDMRREARIMAKLNHPAVVRVYEVFESHGSLFFVMPWLSGGSLRERMDEFAEQGENVDAGTALKWLLRVLEGLQYLHAEGVIHRDLKPGNIMFDEEDNPVIIDFGAAVHCATQTVTQGAFSFSYAAPEQISGVGVPTAATDLYSLAATWYELLSGCMPEETIRRMYRDELVPLQSLPGMDALPESLLRFVMFNMQLEQSARDKEVAFWLECLKGDVPAPQIRRKQQASTLRRVHLIWGGSFLLCAATVALLWWAYAPEPVVETAPPPSLSVWEMPVDKDALYADYEAYHRKSLDAAIQQYEQRCSSMAAIRAEYEAACDAVIEKYRAEPNRDKYGNALDLEMAIFDEINDLYQSFQKRIDEVNDEFYKNEQNIFNNFVYAPERNYPPATAAELAVLPSLFDRLREEYGNYIMLPYDTCNLSMEKYRLAIKDIVGGDTKY